MRYVDRQQAGEALALALETYATPAAVVLALPRGGVIVARPVADRLLAPLDVLIVRKLGAPFNPEYAIGALAQVGEPQWNDEALRYLGVTESHQQAELEQARTEIRRRQKIYRQGRPAPELAGRSVILVDDGIATGYTMLAAARSVRQAGAKDVIVAVPVAAPQSVVLLEGVVDQVVALLTPYPFFAVGEYYTDFAQITDDEVLAALSSAQTTGSSQAPTDA